MMWSKRTVQLWQQDPKRKVITVLSFQTWNYLTDLIKQQITVLCWQSANLLLFGSSGGRTEKKVTGNSTVGRGVGGWKHLGLFLLFDLQWIAWCKINPVISVSFRNAFDYDYAFDNDYSIKSWLNDGIHSSICPKLTSAQTQLSKQ